MSHQFTNTFLKFISKMVRFTVRIEGLKGVRPTATGIVLDKNGHVLTAWHAIYDQGSTCHVRQAQMERANHRVRLSPNKYLADLICSDKNLDIAIVKLRHMPNGLAPAKFGDSSLLKIGSPLYHLGLGDPHFDCGHVVGFFKELADGRVVPYLEVSLAALHGSSGGPFIDKNGRVMGVEWGGGEESALEPPKEVALESNAVKEYLMRQTNSPDLQEIFEDPD